MTTDARRRRVTQWLVGGRLWGAVGRFLSVVDSRDAFLYRVGQRLGVQLIA